MPNWLILMATLLVTAQLAASQGLEAKKLLEAQAENIKKIVSECGTSGQNTTPSMLQDLLNGKTKNPDEKTKCLLKCFVEKMGIMIDGKPNRSAVLLNLSPPNGAEDNVMATLEKCKQLKGDTECDSIYKAFTCFVKEQKYVF